MSLDSYSSVSPKKTIVSKNPIRPKGFSQTSNTPYYKDIYAQMIKEVFDELLKTKRPQLWKYADFEQYKPTTLQQLVCYGTLYLLENMDPSGIYKRLKEVLKVHPIPRIKPIGLAMYIRRDVDPVTFKINPLAFSPQKFDELGVEVTKLIQEYLDDDRNTSVFEMNCALTPIVQQRIIKQLIPLESAVMFVVDDDHIKIIKKL